MTPSDPRFIYMLLVLPGVFGLIMFGGGVSQTLHEEHGGFIHLAWGIFLLAGTAFLYFFLPSFLS